MTIMNKITYQQIKRNNSSQEHFTFKDKYIRIYLNKLQIKKLQNIKNKL